MQHGGAQMLQVQMNMVFVLADTPAFTNFDGLGATDHVARSQILGIGRVALHETLAGAVGEIAALAARTFGDQATRAVDTRRVELHEFHILEWQLRAQHHAAAITGTGVGRSARGIGSAVAAGGENRHLRAKAMQLAVGQIDRNHAATLAVFHHQIDGEIFDEELRLVANGLLIEGMQHCVTGAIGGRAGALGNSFSVLCRHATERTLIDASVIGAGERHTVVLELDNGGRRFLAHELNCVLIAEPVRAFNGVVHMPAPIVLAHISQRSADAALRCDRVAAGRKHFRDIGGRQTCLGQAQRRAQTRAASADHYDVIGMIDELIGAHAMLRNAMRNTA
jgi:hypothetical protein